MDTPRPTKRKRSPSAEKAMKALDDQEAIQPDILKIEKDIFEPRKNYQYIETLIHELRSRSDWDSRVTAAISLCRVFIRITAFGDLKRKNGDSEKQTLLTNTLKRQYAEYKSILLGLLNQEEVATTSLTLSMRILKAEGQYLYSGQEYRFPASWLKDILSVLLKAESDAGAREEFSQQYVEEYDDIRFYTFEATSQILEEGGLQILNGHTLDNVLEILTAIESIPDSKEELEDFWVPAPEKKKHALHSLTQHKKRAQEAWLAVFNIPMEKHHRKRILGQLTTSIVPWFLKPELLMDFLTDSYNAGSSISLLSLSGVFHLIQEKNLDYPTFYRKLYSLLDSGLLHSKHRSRFFRLLDTFLASTHLPAILVASFIKRVSRLCLNAPPAGIVAVIPLIYNLLKKHPTCTFMIHREMKGTEAKEVLENEGMADPFDMKEEDPMGTDAINSSLWELVMLQSHFHPNVATLAKIMSEQFTKHAYNLEDFLDHSYGSMLEAEFSKGIKIPVVEYNIPRRTFTKFEGGEAEDSLLVKLWSFT